MSKPPNNPTESSKSDVTRLERGPSDTEADRAFVQENYVQLWKQYPNRWLIVRYARVLGDYSSEAGAGEAAILAAQLVTYGTQAGHPVHYGTMDVLVVQITEPPGPFSLDASETE